MNGNMRLVQSRRPQDHLVRSMESFELMCGRMRDETRCELCPLNRVQAGMAVRIRQLCASPEVQQRLRELGFCEDQIIRLVTSRNNLICQVCNARLAISEELARLIMVEPVLSRARIR